MPSGLRRYHHSGQSHFLTFSCYRREPRFQFPAAYDLFLACLENMRVKFGMFIYGYVVMPEHVHLLFSEPQPNPRRRHAFPQAIVREALRPALKFFRPILAGSGL